tara:strand:- start:428 stop:709 length:282 start_codon:yes stop_codon:yes gene_type:complete
MQWLANSMLKVDGHDDAIIGIGEGWLVGLHDNGASRAEVLVYSVEKICEKLMKRDGMTYEEAMEYYEFNIVGGYHGEGMPIFLRPYDEYDLPR